MIYNQAMKKVIFCIVLLLFLGGCRKAEAIRFENVSLEKLLAQASRENKPLLIYWTVGESCSPCVYMEKNVLPLPQVVEYFNDNFICGSTGTGAISPLRSSIKDRFVLRRFPTSLILDPNGNELGRIEGRTKDGEEYIRKVKEILANVQ